MTMAMVNGDGLFRAMCVGGPKADHREWCKPTAGTTQVITGLDDVGHTYEVVALPSEKAPNVQTEEQFALVFVPAPVKKAD